MAQNRLGDHALFCRFFKFNYFEIQGFSDAWPKSTANAMAGHCFCLDRFKIDLIIDERNAFKG